MHAGLTRSLGTISCMNSQLYAHCSLFVSDSYCMLECTTIGKGWTTEKNYFNYFLWDTPWLFSDCVLPNLCFAGGGGGFRLGENGAMLFRPLPVIPGKKSLG
jgi:hypothetical protein